MIAFEDTVVDRESELDWETLVTSTTAVANEPAPVPGAVSSGVPIVNAIGRGTAAVGGAAWQSQVTFGTQQRPVDPRAPVVQDGREGKLFLGGITWATDEDAIREYFGRFGKWYGRRGRAIKRLVCRGVSASLLLGMRRRPIQWSPVSTPLMVAE